MSHPLTPDLTGLTDEELFTKRSELMNKLNFAYRTGHGDLVAQIQLVLGDYALETERRNAKMLDDARKSGRLGKDDDSSKDLTR